MFHRLKNKLLRWLVGQSVKMEFDNFRKTVTISEHSVIHPEGRVENFQKNRQAIRIGSHTHIRGVLKVRRHGGEISIGDWCYVGERSEIWSSNSITIGHRVLIAHDVNIHDSDAHPRDPVQRHLHYKKIITEGHPALPDDLPEMESAPIVIEDDVWISFGVTILKGVRIGKGSIISAGSMVLGDVPPDTIYRCKITPVMTALDAGDVRTKMVGNAE